MKNLDYHGDIQRKEEFEESLGLIKSVDSNTYYDFKSLDEDNALNEFSSFKEDVEKMAGEVSAMEGPLYTKESKNALIRENIDKLQQKYIEKAAFRVAQENEKAESLKKRLKSAIDDAGYLSEGQSQTLRNLEAEARSKLAFMRQPRDVESYMKELVSRGEGGDKVAALFASRYGYLFAEKVSTLATGKEEYRSTFSINALIDTAEKLTQSPNTKVRMEMLEKLENRGQTPNMSKRLINMNAQDLKNKYQ